VGLEVSDDPDEQDLRAWKLRSGRPRDSALVFPGPEGQLWSKTTYDNWRKRAFDRARTAARADAATPYALRHSFASLLLHERPLGRPCSASSGTMRGSP
jgi:integrase